MGLAEFLKQARPLLDYVVVNIFVRVCQQFAFHAERQLNLPAFYQFKTFVLRP